MFSRRLGWKAPPKTHRERERERTIHVGILWIKMKNLKLSCFGIWYSHYELNSVVSIIYKICDYFNSDNLNLKYLNKLQSITVHITFSSVKTSKSFIFTFCFTSSTKAICFHYSFRCIDIHKKVMHPCHKAAQIILSIYWKWKTKKLSPCW